MTCTQSAQPAATSGAPQFSQPAATSGAPQSAQPEATSGAPQFSQQAATSGAPQFSQPAATSGAPQFSQPAATRATQDVILDIVQPAHASMIDVEYNRVRAGLPVYTRIAADYDNYPRTIYRGNPETPRRLGNSGGLEYPDTTDNFFGYPSTADNGWYPVNAATHLGYPGGSEYPVNAATHLGIRSQPAYNPVKAGHPVNSGFTAGVFAGFPGSSGTGTRRDNCAVEPNHWRSVGDEVRQAQRSPSGVSSGYCVSEELFEREGSNPFKSVDLQGESKASQREFRISVLHKLACMERCMVQLMRAVDALILTQRQ